MGASKTAFLMCNEKEQYSKETNSNTRYSPLLEVQIGGLNPTGCFEFCFCFCCLETTLLRMLMSLEDSLNQIAK